MKHNYIYIVLLLLIACKNNQQNAVKEEPKHFVPYSDKVAEETLHTDTAFKYENRVGVPGDYQYSYDVSGTDQDGNAVTGNISVRDKYGAGTLTDDGGNEIEVETEWIGNGKLKATDDNGNEYDLDVD